MLFHRLTVDFERVCQQRFGIAPLIVGPGIKTGMPIRCDNPREVGADRIVNGVAGYEKYRTDSASDHGYDYRRFGTATTFDVVSPQAIISAAQFPRVFRFQPTHFLPELQAAERGIDNAQARHW